MNEALRPKFLDLKEGAIVISLKPFVSSLNGLNARVTERNVRLLCGSFSTFTESEQSYRSTTFLPYSMSLKGHTIRVLFPGETMEGHIISTVLTGWDMRKFDKNLRVLRGEDGVRPLRNIPRRRIRTKVIGLDSDACEQGSFFKLV